MTNRVEDLAYEHSVCANIRLGLFPKLQLSCSSLGYCGEIRALELNDRKEQLSFAYLAAVSSVAGFGVQGMWPAPDRDSVDMVVADRGAQGTIKSPRLEVQLKATAASVPDTAHISFPLKLKNYNDLRAKRENLMIPKILLVVFVPGDNVDYWLDQSEETLAMKRCGYWCSLRDMESVGNSNTVSILLPRSNLLTVDALRSIMQGISNGVWP